jgi:AraC-like DNA-binding protein
MWSLLVIGCVLFQTAAAIFLLNAVRVEDDLDKNLRTLLLFLFIHLSTKFLLLAVLGDVFLYTQIPTGFGLAYGPLLLITALSFLERPMRRRDILLQFLPFLIFSLVYLVLVLTGIAGWVAHTAIIRYTSWYQWLVIGSLVGYPLYVKNLLGRSRRRSLAVSVIEGADDGGTDRVDAGRTDRLLVQIANVFLLGISAGSLLSVLRRTTAVAADFDLRLLPYICFSAIPLLILRHRLLKGRKRSLAAVERPIVTRPMEGVHALVAGQPPATEESLTPVFVHADKRYEKSGLDGHKMDEYEAALMSFMEKSRIYLDPDLSLDELAARMKMSRHHLTQLLNDRLMKNFYSFINEYRIGVAIAKLADHAAEVNILSLAFDCGFNSRSSFNNYFKKITGYTPSRYRKMQIDRIVEAP